MGMTSYHAHSSWSDGQTSIAEMIAAATNLDELGCSDHYVLTPYPRQTSAESWSLPIERVGEYVDEVTAAMDSAPLPVRLGLEVDYFPETWEELPDKLGSFPFDYLIGSVHYVDRFNVDGTIDDWKGLSQQQVDEAYEGYWQRIAGLASTGLFDFVGHLDLPKKFAFYASDPLGGGALEALDAIRAADMAIELNTSGWDKLCAQAYPSETLLREARSRQIPVVLTADAHGPALLERHFERGRELLLAVGYTETVRFRQRERTSVPL